MSCAEVAARCTPSITSSEIALALPGLGDLQAGRRIVIRREQGVDFVVPV
jgi:hypothetical protein